MYGGCVLPDAALIVCYQVGATRKKMCVQFRSTARVKRKTLGKCKPKGSLVSARFYVCSLSLAG
jgi:hypothetical protein